MKLVKNSRDHFSEAYRKGLRIGKERLAAISAPDYTEDEIRGILMALEVVTHQLEGKLLALRKQKRQNFKLEICKE